MAVTLIVKVWKSTFQDGNLSQNIRLNDSQFETDYALLCGGRLGDKLFVEYYKRLDVNFERINEKINSKILHFGAEPACTV